MLNHIKEDKRQLVIFIVGTVIGFGIAAYLYLVA